MSEDNIEKFQEQINAELAQLNKTKEELVEKEDKSSVGDKIEPTEDPFLEQAIKEGYNPDFKGPNKKTAEQYVKDGSFFRKIDALNRKIDELTDFNRQTQEHNHKVEKAAYEKALRDLQMQKLDAIRSGEVEKVLNIEKQAEAVHQQINQVAPTPIPVKSVSEDTREFQTKHKDWLNGNSTEDKQMQVMARKVIEYLNEVNPNISEKDGIKEVERRLKSEFPKRFGNPNQEIPSLTAESTTSKTTEVDLSERLSPQQKDFFKNAKKFGSKLTLKDYINQLKLTGDL